MKKAISIFLVLILCVSLSACQSYAAASGTVPEIFGKIVLKIQTDSMSPTFDSGDSIIVEPVDPSTLREGDIISYWTIIDGNRVLNTHRIIEIYDGGDHLIFSTKGDNNNTADRLTVHESEIVGKYVRKAILGMF